MPHLHLKLYVLEKEVMRNNEEVTIYIKPIYIDVIHAKQLAQRHVGIGQCL